MMNNRILAIFATLALGACATDEFDINDVTPSDFTGIAGLVCNESGDPIEHIKVTVDAEGFGPVSAYTSSEGIFMISFEDDTLETDQLDVLIEDIDGDANGGHYSSKTDRILIDEGQKDKIRISLDYRLSLSTASEYSPRS